MLSHQIGGEGYEYCPEEQKIIEPQKFPVTFLAVVEKVVMVHPQNSNNEKTKNECYENWKLLNQN